MSVNVTDMTDEFRARMQACDLQIIENENDSMPIEIENPSFVLKLDDDKEIIGMYDSNSGERYELISCQTTKVMIRYPDSEPLNWGNTATLMFGSSSKGTCKYLKIKPAENFWVVLQKFLISNSEVVVLTGKIRNNDVPSSWSDKISIKLYESDEECPFF